MVDLSSSDINKLITNELRRIILYGQWYGDRTPYYNTIGEVVTLIAGGYVACLPTDVGRQVWLAGAPIGELRDFDNTLRMWYVSTVNHVPANSALTLDNGAGTGAGTTVNAASTDGLYKRCLCLSPKPANLSSSSTDLTDYDYKSYSFINAAWETPNKVLLLTKEFAMPYTKTQPVTIQGTGKAVCSLTCKGDAAKTVYVDSVVMTVYRETNAGVRTPLFTEEYPNSGAGLLSCLPAAYVDPITASAMGTIANIVIATTDIIILKVQIYGHVSAQVAIADAIKLLFGRGGAQTFVELPVLVNPGMI
jgi:hypothetical protein